MYLKEGGGGRQSQKKERKHYKERCCKADEHQEGFSSLPKYCTQITCIVIVHNKIYKYRKKKKLCTSLGANNLEINHSIVL